MTDPGSKTSNPIAEFTSRRGASRRSKSLNRKTSAEIVEEAKNMLANTTPAHSTKSYGGSTMSTLKFESTFRGTGARLVSTRRPVTPREGRQLYTRAAPPGRPPSAFSLRYLQFERGALPNLEPIPQGSSLFDSAGELDSGGVCNGGGYQQLARGFQRSESTGSIADNDNGLTGLRVTTPGTAAGVGRLPALLIPPKIAASLDNLSEGMPPRKDFRQSKETDGGQAESRTMGSADAQQSERVVSVREHPMKKMQAKSHDGHGISLGLHERPPPPLLLLQSTTGRQDSMKLNRSNDLLAQSSTETLLDMLKAHEGIKECSEDTVQQINGILVELYTRVKGARGRWRCAVLGALYGLVESSSSKILLGVARVVLALRVTGSNLAGACKLIFKVARNETNDFLFIDCDVAELLIEGLGRASPIEEPEACVYGYGAVRFLANSHLLTMDKEQARKETRNKCLAFRLAHHGAIQLMVVHLQILNEAGSSSALSGAPLHALFQLSSALRALAGNMMVVEAVNNHHNSVSFTSSASAPSSEECPEIKESLEGNDIQMELAGPHLVKAAEICMNETETQFNIIRTLSALSDIDKCCGDLVDYAARLAILLGPSPERIGKQGNGEVASTAPKPLGLLSRLGYILGNIVGKYDSARINIFNNDVAMEHLVKSLDQYSNREFNGLLNGATGEDTVIDVAVKLVRVVANMGVNEDVGRGLVRRAGLGCCLLNLVQTISQIQVDQEEVNREEENKKAQVDVEELLLATLGALHNLSFYHELRHSDSSGSVSRPEFKCAGTINDRIPELSAALVQIIQRGSIAAQAEAARVLGNMSRSFTARESICDAGGLKILIKNLESEDFELVASSCGVLVNILGDWERRATFRELKGPLLLRDVLQRSATQEDWLLAGIVCQALWNYLIDTTDLVAALGEDEAEFIAGDLLQYLDDESNERQHEGDELYEQFCSVASDLLERVQASISLTHSPVVSVDVDDDDEVDVVGEIGDKWGGRFKDWLEE